MTAPKSIAVVFISIIHPLLKTCSAEPHGYLSRVLSIQLQATIAPTTTPPRINAIGQEKLCGATRLSHIPKKAPATVGIATDQPITPNTPKPFNGLYFGSLRVCCMRSARRRMALADEIGRASCRERV